MFFVKHCENCDIENKSLIKYLAALCIGCKEYLHKRRPDNGVVYIPTCSRSVVQLGQETRHSYLSLWIFLWTGSQPVSSRSRSCSCSCSHASLSKQALNLWVVGIAIPVSRPFSPILNSLETNLRAVEHDLSYGSHSVTCHPTKPQPNSPILVLLLLQETTKKSGFLFATITATTTLCLKNLGHFCFWNSCVKRWPDLTISGTQHHEETWRKWL